MAGGLRNYASSTQLTALWLCGLAFPLKFQTPLKRDCSARQTVRSPPTEIGQSLKTSDGCWLTQLRLKVKGETKRQTDLRRRIIVHAVTPVSFEIIKRKYLLTHGDVGGRKNYNLHSARRKNLKLVYGMKLQFSQACLWHSTPRLRALDSITEKPTIFVLHKEFTSRTIEDTKEKLNAFINIINLIEVCMLIFLNAVDGSEPWKTFCNSLFDLLHALGSLCWEK